MKKILQKKKKKKIFKKNFKKKKKKHYFSKIDKLLIMPPFKTKDSSLTKTILSKIKLARFQKGYSQQNMASELDISQNAYHKIEKGVTKLTLEHFLNICSILEEKPHTFFD